MSTGAPGRGRARFALLTGVFVVCTIVAAPVPLSVGGIVWGLTRDDGSSGRRLTDPFPTPALRLAYEPFRAHLGTCEIRQIGARRTGYTETTCEPGAGAPGPIVFTEYRTPTDLISDSSASIHTFWGSRNGGLLRAGYRDFNWRDHAKRVAISIDSPSDWDVHRLMEWWDTTTAGAVLATAENGAVSASASPTAPPAGAPAAAPPVVAGLPYLVRSFARPWWADLKSCSGDLRGTYSSFYPTLYLGIMIETMYECQLRDGWQQAGGMDKIMFVTWQNRQYQQMEHKAIRDVYGADRLKDQPGLVGPKSGMFMTYQPAGHCVMYWDDEAVSVAAWSLPSCKKGGKTTPASLTAYWQAHG